MIDGYVAGYDAWNECHPDNPEYKIKAMSEKYCTVCGNPVYTASTIAAGRCQSCFEKDQSPQPVPAPKVGEEDPILTRLDIAVIKEKLTDEISEALDIPDGDYDMDYMRGRKAGLEWALKILLKRDRIPVLPTTPETEQPGEVPAETAVFKERWERAEANLKSLTEEDSKKQDALTAIIQACQHIKDNPNVAYILELAEKGINS
jgi:hypothetical protein